METLGNLLLGATLAAAIWVGPMVLSTAGSLLAARVSHGQPATITTALTELTQLAARAAAPRAGN